MTERSYSRVAACFVVAALFAMMFIAGPVGAQDELKGTDGDRLDLDAGQRLAPKVFRAAMQRVLPSVVAIESFGGVRPGGRRGRIRGISRPGDGPTTGLILSADGIVVTSTYNFLRQPPVITVVLQDGRRFVAKLMGRDNTRKICLLKIEGATDLPVPDFANRSQVDVGQWAVALGIGYGDDEPAISVGIVSALGRISGRAIQTDANISPANYGGPLIDLEGRVLGVCVPLHPQAKEVSSGVEWYDSGIGFAVPLAGDDDWIASIRAGKTLQPAQLGVQIKTATAGPDDAGTGAIVQKVQKGTAAAKAEIEVGDQIVAVDGRPISDAQQLRLAVSRHVAGDEIRLRLVREEEEMTLDVTLGVARPPQRPTPKKNKKGKPRPKPEKAPEAGD